MAFSAFGLTLLIGFGTGLFTMLTVRELFIFSVSFSAGYLLSKFGLKRVAFFRFFSKISVGVGGAFVMGVIDRFPFLPIIRLLIGVLIFETALFIHSLFRGIDIYRTCQHCEWHMDWDTCPGMN